MQNEYPYIHDGNEHHGRPEHMFFRKVIDGETDHRHADAQIQKQFQQKIVVDRAALRLIPAEIVVEAFFVLFLRFEVIIAKRAVVFGRIDLDLAMFAVFHSFSPNNCS